MKLSCLPVSLYADLGAGRRTLADWFALAATLGLDGADISVMHLGNRAPGYLDALCQQARDAGIQIAMLATYPDFTHPDAGARARQIEEVIAWIEAGARLGVSALRLTAGQNHPGVDEADGLTWAAEGLTACAAKADAAGVRVLYENHVRGAPWERNDFTQLASRFIEVARRTRGSGLGILFDTANNLALGEEPMTVLETVLDRIGAVHVSDIRYRGTFEPTVIGTGVAPIRQLLSRIVASGFDGWVSVEEASHTGDEGIARAVAFADREWIEAGGRARTTSAARTFGR